MQDKFGEKDEELDGLFNDPEYPQEIEYEQFIEMCEVVRDNFICVDPKDKSLKAFIEKEKTCEKAL